LPNDLILYILHFTTLESLVDLSSVCKKFYQILQNNNQIWEVCWHKWCEEKDINKINSLGKILEKSGKKIGNGWLVV